MLSRYQIRRTKWKAAGLCSRCGKNKPELEKVQCKACSERRKISRAQEVIVKKASGICRKCDNIAIADRTLCPAHLETEKIRGRNRGKKKEATGKCAKCSDWALPGKTLCTKHAELKREYNQKVRKARMQRMKDEGRCTRCTEKLHPQMDEGKLTCLNCREKLC